MLKSQRIVTEHEMDMKENWVKNVLLSDAFQPFSLKLDGVDALPQLKSLSYHKNKLDSNKMVHVKTGIDVKSNLEIRCEAVEYLDFPIVEWTIFLKNTGVTKSPLIEAFYALDSTFGVEEDVAYILHHQNGSPAQDNDYEPYDTILEKKSKKVISTFGGRSSNSHFPYFNIEYGNEGINFAIGWPGQWSTAFERDSEDKLIITCGQENVHFSLLEWEEVRSPLIVLQFWESDLENAKKLIRSKNIFKRWMVKHNSPNKNGNHITPSLAGCTSHQYNEMINADETCQKNFIDLYYDKGIRINYWWMDAGWYECSEDGWFNIGTWSPDINRFPNGLRAVTDYAREKGIQSILWFEPERVTKGSQIYKEHPEWLLNAPENPGGYMYREKDSLLDLGIPAAREYITEIIDKMIISEGIDLYRQDFNQDPLLFWENNEDNDRQGIIENKYIMGYLAFWDELRRRHPGMLIDSCASGGRRNDVETLRRSVPLLRSDRLFEPVSQQGHTWGISQWIPFHGTGTMFGKSALPSLEGTHKRMESYVDTVDVYAFRSHMAPHITGCWDLRIENIDYKLLNKLIKQWRKTAVYLTGDFYPLTSYSLHNDVWMAWQFYRPDLNGGVVQVFRRSESPYSSAVFKLCGLIDDAIYEIHNLDDSSSMMMSGDVLINEGLLIELDNPLDTALYIYRKR